MKIGYARVSKGENMRAQRDALEGAGCNPRGNLLLEPAASGGRMDKRLQLKIALERLRPGDSLIVWKLDRLSRSMIDLVNILAKIEAAKAHLVSLTESFDTGSPGGRGFFHMLGAVAEMERGFIRERTMAGLKSARARGVKFGRKHRLGTDQIAVWCELIAEGKKTIRAAAIGAGVGHATMKRYWSAWRAQNSVPPRKRGSQVKDIRSRRAGHTRKNRTRKGIAPKSARADARRGTGAGAKAPCPQRGGKKIPRAASARKSKRAKTARTRSRGILSNRKS